jgi:nicotinamidase-related amidase
MNTNSIERDGCALVLVDWQQRLLPALDGGSAALERALQLADVARLVHVPVIGTEQNPAGLGPNAPEIRERCTQTLSKMHFDACSDGLLPALQTATARPLRDVVLAGCEAHVCLMQTALGLRRAGLHVWIVAEACASRDPAHHALAMQRLREAGAAIVSVEMVAFEWLRSCEDSAFREVLARLK